MQKKLKMRLKEIVDQNEKDETEYKKEEQSARGQFKMQLQSSEKQRDFSSNRPPSYWLPYEPRRKFFMDFHSGTPFNFGGPTVTDVTSGFVGWSGSIPQFRNDDTGKEII